VFIYRGGMSQYYVVFLYVLDLGGAFSCTFGMSSRSHAGGIVVIDAQRTGNEISCTRAWGNAIEPTAGSSLKSRFRLRQKM
jgi:hypothetical protein